MASIFDSKIELLNGMSSLKAELLNKELGIFTFGDLLEHYPFRYEDRTQFYKIKELSDTLPSAQIIGKISTVELVQGKGRNRLVATLSDETGSMELVWFQGITYFQKFLKPGTNYLVYGKPAWFGGFYSIQHPEMEFYNSAKPLPAFYQAIYPLTEKLRKKYVDSKSFTIWIKSLLPQIEPYIKETLPASLVSKYRLVSKKTAYIYLHLPPNTEQQVQAIRRLKFEELFYNQLKLISLSLVRKNEFSGQIFQKTTLLTTFYKDHLPFDLTCAQKRVIREIFEDMKTGKQMNRLVQGDVGSGKTIVAFICMLMAIDGGAQACMMAPTEILAQQHFANLEKYCNLIDIPIKLLTGSSTKAERKEIHEGLLNGSLSILVGTHAVLEDIVQFQNLGLVVIDEQHRFGVAQRAKLWEKGSVSYPHMLVMTATPIPRTLAMTLYGDLDISEIDELPPGRKPIKTVHRYEANRLSVWGFLKDELQKGKQVYIVFPLIEESETLDLKNLFDGYEHIKIAFPNYAISIVHGRMKPKEKQYEMLRFKKNETQIMVATTVIEVGVDVPNASVMLIENAQRYGLSQLHQLRGRVGRGADQSYCILMTDYNISSDTRRRIETMVESENGFYISKVDLELRGPGDMAGTQQSGIVDLKLANLAKDEEILKIAREEAFAVLNEDPEIEMTDHLPIKLHLDQLKDKTLSWSRIS